MSKTVTYINNCYERCRRPNQGAKTWIIPLIASLVTAWIIGVDDVVITTCSNSIEGLPPCGV